MSGRPSLTILIFSRNATANVINIAKETYGTADEIVVMDSSDSREKRMLVQKGKGLKKLKIFDVLAFGYPDPLRMYGLKKCKGEWILLLDVDELLGAALLKDIKKLISSTTASAFAIKRYEDPKGEEVGGFFTWQIRLMRREKVLYKGLRHEQPQINGEIRILEDPRYYMEHRHIPNKEDTKYGKIEKIDTRLSYSLYNEKMLEYLSRTAINEGRRFKKTATYRIVSSFMRFYEAITFRNPEDEIGSFDYFWLYFSVTLGYAIKAKTMSGVIRTGPIALGQLKQMQAWHREADSDELFEISKIINRIGITRFLELDKEGAVRKMYLENRHKKQGIDLLMNLLKLRYERLHPK
jgi:hypothetical protein